MSTFSTPSTWSVRTDRGDAQLVLKGEEDIRRPPASALLITDSHGVGYRIADARALDKALAAPASNAGSDQIFNGNTCGLIGVGGVPPVSAAIRLSAASEAIASGASPPSRWRCAASARRWAR